MSWCNLDLVRVCAVDNENTVNHHQGFSVDFDKKSELYTLHYSTYYCDTDRKPKFSIPSNFVDTLCEKTPSEHEKKVEIEKSYAAFIKEIRPGGKANGFQKNVPAYALTCDITFTPDFVPIDFNARPTLCLMTEKCTNEQAAARAQAKPSDNPYRLWHDVIQANSPPDRHGQKRETINFSEVTSRTSEMIQTGLRKMAFRESIDCVYRVESQDKWIDFKENKEDVTLSPQEWVKRYGPYYGSVLKKKSRAGTEPEGPEKAIIQATAGRKHIDAFNIPAAFKFLEKNGTNVFPEGVAVAVANYQRHIQTWQRMGMMA